MKLILALLVTIKRSFKRKVKGLGEVNGCQLEVSYLEEWERVDTDIFGKVWRELTG